MSARRGVAGVALASIAVLTGCARRSAVETRPLSLPQDGPPATLFFAQVVSQSATPTSFGSARLRFAVEDAAHVLVGQVRSGTIQVLFPASPEGTGFVRAHDTVSVPLDYNGTGPVFLITRKGRLNFTAPAVGRYFAELDIEEFTDSDDPIAGIEWFARQVGGTNYRVEIAGVAPSMTAGAGPSGSSVQAPRRHTWKECRPAPRVIQRPARADSVMTRPDAVRDPAADRIVCVREP